MNTLPPEPLDAEERALADQLARLGARAEPSAALDTRILAAAHGVERVPDRAPYRTAHRRTPKQRWPVAFAAVATLALAVGIAWQLRPTDQFEPVRSQTPAATRADSAGPSAFEDEDFVAAPPPAQRSSAPAPMERIIEPAAPQIADPIAESASSSRAKELAEPQAADAQVAAAPAAEASMTSEVPPAPAPPPADARMGAQAGIVFDAPAETPQMQGVEPSPELDHVVVTGSRIPDSKRRSAEDAAQARARRAPAEAAANAAEEAEAAGGITADRDNAGFTDDEIDDEPPATADSPQVQRAWLRDIRGLLARGQTGQAQASLVEFKRRYPRYVLPDDLQKLVEVSP